MGALVDGVEYDTWEQFVLDTFLGGGTDQGHSGGMKSATGRSQVDWFVPVDDAAAVRAS
jgi:hypothetical protein